MRALVRPPSFLRLLPLVGIPTLAAALFSPAAAAQSDAPLPEGLDALTDAIFAEWDRPDSPGCALGVYRDGSIVYARGYGMADLERGVPITPHTVFDIGSTSKQFAAASILLLAHDGALSLDDDVRKHVPEIPAYSRPITIRHLLHHTSGLRDYIGLLTLSGVRIDDVATSEDALAIIARQKELNFDPGDEHLYSNSGYFLLSVIVERASGRSLRDFAHERIFEPLGMSRTHYLGSYDDIVPDRALAYSRRPNGELRTDVSRWLQLGDGAVFTTVEELLLWDRNFYDPRVGGEGFLSELQGPGTLTNGEALTYALGLQVSEYRGERTVSHGGSWGGYRAELVRFPDQRFSVATLCNLGSTNPSRLARRVADIHLADALDPEAERAEGEEAPPAAEGQGPEDLEEAGPAPLAAEELAAYEGRFHSEELDVIYRLEVAEGELVLYRPSASPQALEPTGPDELGFGPAALRFTRGPDGGISGYLLDIGRVRNLRFDRLPDGVQAPADRG
jgi:CubicO group peptidase (beta-lactamase class C family)